MEATGDYRKPVLFLLEREGFECLLYHAAQVKALPGRPRTGKLDSVRLAEITERGSLPSGFIPPEPIRRLRACTRYRRHLAQARTAEKQRAEKLPEDAHLKLSSVISGIFGVSGRDMLAAIIAGERDPKVLAQLARRRMRSKTSVLEQALVCTFVTGEHVFVLTMMLASIDHLTAQISELSAETGRLCEPYLHQIGQLCATPGTDVTTARDITGEIGVDMTVFPAAGHLTSWARRAPRVTRSGGKRKGRNASGQGTPCSGAARGEAAISAGRTQSFPGARHRRLCKRMPKKKAQVATGRSLITTWYHLLSDPDATYQDLGAGYCERRLNIRRQARSHARAIERPGCKVTIEPPGPQTSPRPAITASSPPNLPISPKPATLRTAGSCHLPADHYFRTSQAAFRCTACGYARHADVNAAINIAAGHAVTARGGGDLSRPVNREPKDAPVNNLMVRSQLACSFQGLELPVPADGR